jgi:hypothetical protein
VGDHQELIRLECCFVFHNAVLRNSYAVSLENSRGLMKCHTQSHQRG